MNAHIPSNPVPSTNRLPAPAKPPGELPTPWRGLCVPLLALCLSSCSSLGTQTSSAIVKHETFFQVTLPKGFEMTKRTPVEDFEIYSIASENRTFVSIYLGNQPHFPHTPGSENEIVARFQTRDVQMISRWVNNQLVGREILINLGTKVGWPAFLPAWIADLPPAMLPSAEQVLFSLATNAKP